MEAFEIDVEDILMVLDNGEELIEIDEIGIGI
jgi:hypothetical protein